VAIVTGKTLKIQDTKTPEPESVEVGGSIPPGSLQEEVKTSTPKKGRKEMTPTSPIIDALAWGLIGGLVGSIICIVFYDIIDRIVKWFRS
jgi:hypothetical protein